MKISAVLAGGLGDMILAMRYVAAARDEYPNAFITIYCNDKGKSVYSDFIKKHWRYLFDKFVVVDIISLDFRINSIFGDEHYPDAYANISQTWRNEIEAADRVYHFWPDSMKCLDYRDIPWMKYNRFIPTPIDFQEVLGLPDDFVALNLYARQDSPSYISKHRSNEIIQNLIVDNNVVIVAPSQEIIDTFYSEYKQFAKVFTLDECVTVCKKSRIGVSVDTGIRCLFHSFGKSCYTLTINSNSAFVTHPRYEARWYPWKENVLPINVHPKFIHLLVNNARKHSGCELFPQINPDTADVFLIKRNR